MTSIDIAAPVCTQVSTYFVHSHSKVIRHFRLCFRIQINENYEQYDIIVINYLKKYHILIILI